MLSQHNASKHSTPQSPEVASVAVRAQGAQTFRRVQKEDGSNVDKQLKIIQASVGGRLHMDHQQGSFRPVGHLQVAGRKTHVAIAIEIALQRSEMPQHHCVWDTKLARSNERHPWASAFLLDHLISRPMNEAGIRSNAHRR